MEPLIGLVDRYVTAHTRFAVVDVADQSVDDLQAEMNIARHTLELRIAELTGLADGARLVGEGGANLGNRFHALIVGQVA